MSSYLRQCIELELLSLIVQPVPNAHATAEPDQLVKTVVSVPVANCRPHRSAITQL